ncbi:ethylmalonyl-CoA decarboxylase-like isoform X2 [Photinus pyralis]|nr:ethylmalonyl-CoA decarboxylase-like isoform X2 [Photinus pyralis]
MIDLSFVKFFNPAGMADSVQQPRSFSRIRKMLVKFPGGGVSLIKDERSGIAEIVLDYPEIRNGMSGVMMVELRERVLQLENWTSGKGLILRGKGGNFCSGGDLNFAKSSTAEEGLAMSVWMRDTLTRLQRLPLVSVCLVHGPCLGGGAEMAVFCDYILAAEDVQYGFVHGKMGIVTAWGGGTQLVQRIGRARALDLFLTARVMSAEECVEIGLAEAVVASPVDLSKVTNWLKLRLTLPSQITRAFKTIVSSNHMNSQEDALNAESETFAPFWGGAMNKEALNRNIKHSKI